MPQRPRLAPADARAVHRALLPRPRGIVARTAVDLLRGLAAHDPDRLGGAHAPGEPARDRAHGRTSRRCGALGRVVRVASGPRARRPGSIRKRPVRFDRRDHQPSPGDRGYAHLWAGGRSLRARRRASRCRRLEARLRRVGTGLRRSSRCRERRWPGRSSAASRRRSLARRRAPASVRDVAAPRGAARGRSDDPRHLHRSLAGGIPRPRAVERPLLQRGRRRSAGGDAPARRQLAESALVERRDVSRRLAGLAAQQSNRRVHPVPRRRRRRFGRPARGVPLRSARTIDLASRLRRSLRAARHRRQARSRRRRPRRAGLAAAAGHGRASRSDLRDVPPGGSVGRARERRRHALPGECRELARRADARMARRHRRSRSVLPRRPRRLRDGARSRSRRSSCSSPSPEAR